MPHTFSAQNAASIFALRQELVEVQRRRRQSRQLEEETLLRLFEEAGGSRDMLDPKESLSARAVKQLLAGSEGEQNLTHFKQRYLIK